MADNEMKNLCVQYARNKATATTHILDCGDVSNPYVQAKYAITMLKVYNGIIESYGGSIAAYLHEKQFTSNMPDWVHKPECPCYSANWVHPGAKIFVEDDDCFCDISGLFIDFDIKLSSPDKTLTQEIVNELAFEITKLLYQILAQAVDVVEGVTGKTGIDAHVGPVEGFRPQQLKNIQDTIVCYSSHRANNGRGRALEKFKEEHYKEGIHLMYPGLMLQRDTKKRIIHYLRGVAKDKNSDLFKLLENKIPNNFPGHPEIPGCYVYIDESAYRNLTVPYGSVKHSPGKPPGACNYLDQTCNYFVFANRDFNKDDPKVKTILDFSKAQESEIYLDAEGRKRTRMFMFNYNKTQLKKMYPNFNMTIELSLIYKEYDKDGYVTGLVRQVPYKIPDTVKEDAEFLEYSKEYKSKKFAVNHDIKTRLEDKAALDVFEKNHIGYCSVLNETLGNSPMLKTYNIVSSLSRKRASEEPTWYMILVKLKQIAGYFKRDADGLEIAKHFSRRHCRHDDPGYYDEDFLIEKWTRLPLTVIDDETKTVSDDVFFSNFYSLLSLVKVDNMADYVNFCDNDFMERISKYILEKKAFPSGISDVRANYSIGPNEMVDIIISYIKPFYKSGMLHGEKTWAEFDVEEMRWKTYPAREQPFPVSLEGFISKFINDLINNITSKYLRCFDTGVGVLFNRILSGIKRDIKIVSGYRVSGNNDIDDSDDEDIIPDGPVRRTTDDDSLARVIGRAKNLIGDGDDDIDEEDDDEDDGNTGRAGRPGRATVTHVAARKPKEEFSLTLGELAKYFRWYCIRTVGGNITVTAHDTTKYNKAKASFETTMRKMKISVSPEIKANYFSYISAVGTYDEISKFPIRYLQNMGPKLFSSLRDDNFFEVKDSHSLFLGVRNGVLELRHCDYPVLHKGYHNFPVTMQMGCEYKQFDPTDRCTILVLRALKGLFKDCEHDAFDYMLKSLCLALDLDVHDTTFDFFYGGGGNGKSTITNFMTKTFKEYASDMSISLIEKGRNKKQAGVASPELLKHENKRFILIAEANDIIFDPNVLKKITGGEDLEGRAMYSGNDRSFKVRGRVVITVNNVPTFTTDDEGIRRRVISVPFKRSFIKATVKQTDENQIYENPAIMKYAEEEKYRTAFLSILTFYYANLSGVCHAKYYANMKITTTTEVEEWKKENPNATKEEVDVMTKKIFEQHVEDYIHKPHETFTIGIANTGRSFPSIETATQQFQKEASPAYRFLADRVFSLVHLEKQVNVRPITPKTVENSEEFNALPTQPTLNNAETAAYRGIAPLKTKEQHEMIDANEGITINDGSGNFYSFLKVKGSDNYVIDDDDVTEEETTTTTGVTTGGRTPGVKAIPTGSKIAFSRFPFKSFTRSRVDLDFIIDQYNEYQQAIHRPPATAEIKKGFGIILNKYCVFGNSAKFEVVFIDNHDYKSMSKISNFIEQNNGAIKPFSSTLQEGGVPVSFKTYIEALTTEHKKLLGGLTQEQSVMQNTVENYVVPFGYSTIEKSKSIGAMRTGVRVHNALAKVTGNMFKNAYI